MITQFYHGLFRKYTIAFGNIFSGIQIERVNADGVRVQNIAIPIAWGPKQGFLTRLAQDPNLEREIADTLPRMGFEITSINYDGQRKLNKTLTNVKYGGTTSRLNKQFSPVPYNIYFQLSIFSKNSEDAFRIIEEILPYFGPEYTVSINAIPSMGISVDAPVTLQSVSIEDSYNVSFTDRRVLIWNLDFEMKALLFGPISSTGIIQRADVNLYAANTADSIPNDAAIVHKVVTTPGLLANGSPTTNSSLSIPYNQIGANTDYGFAQDYYYYSTGDNQ